MVLSDWKKDETGAAGGIERFNRQVHKWSEGKRNITLLIRQAPASMMGEGRRLGEKKVIISNNLQELHADPFFIRPNNPARDFCHIPAF